MTNMAETSLSAFHSIEPDLQRKEAEVMAVFTKAAENGTPLKITREALANLMGWKESSCCGRCNSLIKSGHLEEVTGGKTSTGRSAMLVRLPAEQLELV